MELAGVGEAATALVELPRDRGSAVDAGDQLVVIVFIPALIAPIMNGGIGFVERKSLRWQTTQEGGQVISL